MTQVLAGRAGNIEGIDIVNQSRFKPARIHFTLSRSTSLPDLTGYTQPKLWDLRNFSYTTTS